MNDARYFSYRNYSIPRNDPVHNALNIQLLSDAISRKMGPCHVVVIMAGVYSTYSKWIQREIAIAQAFQVSKPILAVKPWANKQVSTVVRDNADRLVAWNTSSIVTAIRDLA